MYFSELPQQYFCQTINLNQQMGISLFSTVRIQNSKTCNALARQRCVNMLAQMQTNCLHCKINENNEFITSFCLCLLFNR